MFTRTLWFLLGLVTGITLIAKIEQYKHKKTQYSNTNHTEDSVVELDAKTL